MRKLLYWLFNLHPVSNSNASNELDVFRTTVFILMHLACLLVFITGYSPVAIWLAITFYIVRMFFITAFYHRYFSHKTFKTNRIMQFLMAFLGCTAGQRGPLWWASHHRQHHMTSDTNNDPHSPSNGLINSHLLWFLRKNNFNRKDERIRDWLKYPELVLMEHMDWLPFLLFAIACYVSGDFLSNSYPELGADGFQLLVWGFFISTIVLYHATYTINSIAHKFGSRRYETKDNSRNNPVLALITLGEGWHNNHHRYPNSVKQGFLWWEIDISYMFLWLMSKMGMITQMKTVPATIMQEGRGK